MFSVFGSFESNGLECTTETGSLGQVWFSRKKKGLSGYTSQAYIARNLGEGRGFFGFLGWPFCFWEGEKRVG